MIKNIILLASSLFISFSINAEEYTIDEYLKSNLKVDIYIQGAYNGDDSDADSLSAHGNGMYFGECMMISGVNHESHAISIIFKAGSYLKCNDSTVQNMIITKSSILEIPAGDSVGILLNAMCAQKVKYAPNQYTGYYFGVIPDSSLYRMAKLIEDKKLQNDIGQLCMWAISDRASYSDLAGYEETPGGIDEAYAIVSEFDSESPFVKSYDQREAFVGKVINTLIYIGIGSLIFIAGLIYLIVRLTRTKKPPVKPSN